MKKPTMRVSGDLMADISVKFSISFDDIVNILTHAYMCSDEYPRSKEECIERIKIYLHNFGKDTSRIIDATEKEYKNAEIWANIFFPEFF